MILLFHFWFGMSSSILSPVLDALSYALGFRFLQPYVWPDSSGSGNFPFPSLADYPSGGSAGGCFIGTDAAWWSARELPAPGTTPGPGHLRLLYPGIPLTDVSVLVPLSYIPAGRIVYSLITVTVSSFMIDFIQNFGIPRKDGDNGKETAADNRVRIHG